MTRRPIIAANWKMHHDHLVAIQVVQKLSYRLERDDYEACDVVICAPFTDLRTLQTLTEADRIPILLGAQNCHWQDRGAFTGEVSPVMLAKLNVRYVIVGHSERRELFGETDAFVNQKLLAVLKHEMTPVLCVGETLAERESGATETKVIGQLEADFVGVSPAAAAKVVIAYEPIWAIGTGRTASPADAQAMCKTVRSWVAEHYSAEVASTVRAQYGGSVTPANIAELMAQADIDGALVGGASLDAERFAQIVRLGR